MVTPSAKLAPGEEQTFVPAGEVFVLKERVSETLTLDTHCARHLGACHEFSLTVNSRRDGDLAARAGRHGFRDHALMFVAYRHGLRASEATGARREDVDLEEATIWVRRLKGGLSTEQPLAADEIDALTAYLATRTDREPWLFLSSQGGRMTRQNFHYLVGKAGDRAELGHVHPHTLRHSCGHVLSNQGADTRLVQDWLGHRDIRHTARYTRTAAARFQGLLWK